MHCSTVVLGAIWNIHQYQFQLDLKVLRIPQYDIILGMDWLQLFSPMKVDWNAHWLTIPYKGHSVTLQGVSDSLEEDSSQLMVQVFSLDSTVQTQSPAIPPAISALLAEFPTITTPPENLPPNRACDHEIPLVEGARLVSVRPYRYPLLLKMRLKPRLKPCSNRELYNIVHLSIR